MIDESTRAELLLTYGVKCDLYHFHIEHNRTELFHKVQMMWWLDGSDIHTLLPGSETPYTIDITQIGNLIDGVNLAYRGVAVKHVIQVTVF
jgi:hypothetical protein